MDFSFAALILLTSTLLHIPEFIIHLQIYLYDFFLHEISFLCSLSFHLISFKVDD